jgi:hypothetical protein
MIRNKNPFKQRGAYASPTKCKMVRQSELNVSSFLNSHTDPFKSFQKLLEQAECKTMCFPGTQRGLSVATQCLVK